MTLQQMAKSTPEDVRPVAMKLSAELVFMARTLGKLRRQIDRDGPVELFENGKQRMTRQSPAFQAYVAMAAKYSLMLRQLVALMPKDERPEQDELDAFLAGDY